jgi:2',3'-cyclic-nucleotide 2'-phosphodiesterase (5'-nucleotidase family)
MSQATFPVLQANVTEDPANPYGLAAANVQPYVEKTLGDINVAILGIGNHRIPNYELPSNIPGLTFSDPIAKTQELSDLLRSTNDVVIALTHIGFTENPSSVEVDANVDTNLVMQTRGLDAVVGGHSHTDPAVGFGAYKYLPTIVADANGNPVAITQALRYNNTLGEVSLGLLPLGGGDYEVVSQTGRYIKLALTDAEDPAIDAIVTPYSNMLAAYNNTVLGQTTVAIDALESLHPGDQRRQPAGGCLRVRIGDRQRHPGGLPPLWRDDQPGSRHCWPLPRHPSRSRDMFTLMPYENSLVVMEMNGPQLKAVLERAYRNYYYYKYVPGYGGYSYYTTCMLDTNFGNQITYNDLYPAAYDPTKEYVVSLVVDGIGEIDFDRR